MQTEELTRTKVSPQDTWDLIPLYPNWESWEQEYSVLETALPQVAKFQGRLAESAEVLGEALAYIFSLSRSLEKLHVFSRMRSDEDLTNSVHLGYLQRSSSLATRLSTISSYFRPELMAIPPLELERWLKTPSLAAYRRYLEDLVRYRPHTLSGGEERLLALGGEVISSCERVFSQLNNSDLTFGSISVEGKEVKLTHGTFNLLLKNQNREVRKECYEKFYAAFDAHKNTLSSTLTGSIQADIFQAKARSYPSALEHALFGERIETDVYTNLIETVSARLDPLHRYYRFRQSRLQLPEQYLYDTYVGLVPSVDVEISFDEGVQLLLDAVKPLGDEYVSVLRRGLTSERWVDRYENDGKNSGAYSSGCYDSAPYILMNYKARDLRNLFTLAHEAGHSMHSYFSRKHQSYQDSDYSIFVAEVASTFNEALLNNHLRLVYKNNPAMQAYLINQQIDDIKATLYRQTMFAEFEMLAHALLERHEPLTVEVYREQYRKLLEKYFGSSVTVSSTDELELFRIPHFYWAFYVYKYSTGIAAATTLAARTLSGDASSTARYLSFLKSGGSKYSLDLLRDAGVDMTQPEPVQGALNVFDGLVTELEGAINRL